MLIQKYLGIKDAKEKTDIDEFLEMIAKSKFIQQVEQNVLTRAIVKAFESENAS